MPLGPVKTEPRSLAPTTNGKGLYAKGALKNAKIEADPVRQPMMDFRKNHPILSSIGDFMTSGATDPNYRPGPVDVLGSLPIGELTKAGLSFVAIRGGKSVYHGTQRVFEHFDPSKYDKSDVLGWMTHLAEDPEYASKYATGDAKGIRSIGRPKSNIIPARIEAKNVLDLVNPNADDMSQALAAMGPLERKKLIEGFKITNKNLKTGETFPSNYLNQTHYGGRDVPINETAVRELAEQLRMTPEDFKRSPFDAIRYNDTTHKSWAVPEGTQIRSALSGVPLTKEHPISPISMRPMDINEPKGNLPTISSGLPNIRNDKYKITKDNKLMAEFDNYEDASQWADINTLGNKSPFTIHHPEIEWPHQK